MMTVPPPDGGPAPGRLPERAELETLLALLDGYEAFHARLSVSLSTVSRLALAHRSEDPLRVQVVLDFLSGPLPEHLADEERRLLPALSALDPPPPVAEAMRRVQDGARLTRETIAAMLPALTDLAAGRGLQATELLDLRSLVQELRSVLGAHLMVEEQVLFPWVRGLSRAGG